MEAADTIRAAAERVTGAHGLELFDVQVRREGSGWVVRVTVDRPGPANTPEESVSVEDCARVSRELSTILDVEDPLDRAYTLEVSSPGLDRPLRHEADFRRFTGRRAAVVTTEAVERQTFFSGRIRAVDAGSVTLQVGRSREVRIPLDRIKRAHLEIELQRSGDTR